MFADLLNSSYFALFLIVALGFMLGRIKIKGLSLDVSAVIFIALLFGHFGVIIPKELGNFGLVLFIFTIGIQAGPGFFDSFRSKGKTLIIITLLIICSAALTAVGLKYAFDIDTPSVVGLIAGALTSTPGLAVAIDSTHSPLASIAYGIAYPFGVIGVILFVKLLRQLGLLLFLAEVGTSAGRNLVATFQESGWLLFGVGAAITLVPMLVAVIVGLFVFKINILDLLGTITGGMTSTPGLAAADSMTDSNIPSVAYATVYPIAMVFLILVIQVIASAVY